MSKKATSAMGYHEAYLKADAASRNIDLDLYKKETSSESDSSDDQTANVSKNVSQNNSNNCK